MRSHFRSRLFFFGSPLLLLVPSWAAAQTPAEEPVAPPPSTPVEGEHDDSVVSQDDHKEPTSGDAEAAATPNDPEAAPSSPDAAPSGSESAPSSPESNTSPDNPPSTDESPDQKPATQSAQEAQNAADSEATSQPVAVSGDKSVEQEEEELEVTVLGSQLAHAGGSVQVLRESQLKRFEYDDPHAALMQVPGVYVRQEDGMGLRPNIGMRGANPDRSKKITLMEDGILFGPAPYSAPAGYFFPLLTRMTQINVIKGPSAIAYGPQTVGGAIDFVSRAIPSETSGSLDLGLGEYGYGKAHAYFGTSTEQLGFLVEGVRLQNTGFAELPSGADTGSTRNEWMMKANYILDPRAATQHEFNFKFTYSDEVSNETYLGQTDADFRENPYRRYPASALDRFEGHRTSFVVSHVMDLLEPDLTLVTSVYRNDYQRAWTKLNRLGGAAVADVLANPENPANAAYYGVLTGELDTQSPTEVLYVGPNDRTFVSQGIQSKLTANKQTGVLEHNIEAGLRLHHDQITRLHTEDGFAMVEGELIRVADTATITSASNRANTQALAAHVTDAVTWRSLTVSPGIRAEFIRSDTKDYLTDESADRFLVAVLPGVGMFYEFLPGWGALGGIYRGFSPPAPASDEVVDPEYSVNYEAGTRLVKGKSRAELVGFYNDYSNMTDVCTLSSGCVTDNLDRQFDAGKARIYGLEAFAGHDVQLPLELQMPITFSYTLTYGEFLSDFQSADPIYGDVSQGDAIPYLPRHQANLSWALEHRFAGINASGTFVGQMRERASSGDFETGWTTDEQLWLDVGVYAKPIKWLKIYGNLRNVTNTANLVGRRPYGARVNAPRWLQVGAQAEF